MRNSAVFVLLLAGVTGILALQIAGNAQTSTPMHQGPMGPGHMTSDQMQLMQQNMAQMSVTIEMLRVQLDKVNPQLLTGQERPMYEYLRILQGHMERMQSMFGTMMQMPGMHR